jgi:uncharacterized protein
VAKSILIRAIGISIVLWLISACASFYEVTNDFTRDFENGKIESAFDKLRHDKQYAKASTKFLYYINSGLLLSMQGKYVESNTYFEKAYLFGEDYKVNYLSEAASFLTNPMITVYKGEDHEHLFPLYYKALNFLKLKQYEEALVECRRLNQRLIQLSDKYKSPDRFQRDAFIHNLMGIIYQASNDWNNAFIAYRNALEIYETDYAGMFKMDVPEQLKIDLLVSAWNIGFMDEFNFYKEKFSLTRFSIEQPAADLIFFWHNGLGPVKDEWNINIAVNRASDDAVVFTSDGFPVNFKYGYGSRRERTEIRDLEMFRLSIPKYVERPVYNTSAHIKTDTSIYQLQLAEDVNKIAFKSLNDRLQLELGKSLLRAAMKKAAEQSIRNENSGVGALVGLVNAMTEKADTRNWQTLPHSIYYTRVPLREGENKMQFVINSAAGDVAKSFTYNAVKGQTLFHTFTSLECRWPTR